MPERRRIVGSPQQEEFWSFVLDEDASAVLHSCAGTGKTTTALEAMHRVLEVDPSLRILYLAFSRATADEFRPLCPPGVTVSTLHALGLRSLTAWSRSGGDDGAWGTIVSQRLEVAPDKTMKLLKKMSTLPYDRRRTVADLVKFLKSQAIRPGVDKGRVFRLSLDRGELLEPWQIDCACDLLHRCAEDTSTIDYDDMIWLPLILEGVTFPRYDLIFVNKAQDLDPAQHELLLKMRRRPASSSWETLGRRSTHSGGPTPSRWPPSKSVP